MDSDIKVSTESRLTKGCESQNTHTHTHHFDENNETILTYTFKNRIRLFK